MVPDRNKFNALSIINHLVKPYSSYSCVFYPYFYCLIWSSPESFCNPLSQPSYIRNLRIELCHINLIEYWCIQILLNILNMLKSSVSDVWLLSEYASVEYIIALISKLSQSELTIFRNLYLYKKLYLKYKNVYSYQYKCSWRPFF